MIVALISLVLIAALIFWGEVVHGRWQRERDETLARMNQEYWDKEMD